MIGNMVQDECEGALERSSPRLSLVLQQSMVGAAALPPGRDREGSKGEGGGTKKKRRSQTDLFYIPSAFPLSGHTVPFGPVVKTELRRRPSSSSLTCSKGFGGTRLLRTVAVEGAGGRQLSSSCGPPKAKDRE